MFYTSIIHYQEAEIFHEQKGYTFVYQIFKGTHTVYNGHPD